MARLRAVGSDEAAAVADFDGDGNLDLAVTYTLSDGVGIWIGNGDGTFNLKPSSNPSTVLFPVGQEAYGILAVNIVGDNNTDLLSADITNLGGRDGGFDAHSGWSVGAFGITDSVVTGDFDADGNLDVAIANGQTEELTLLRSNGTGGFTVDTRIVPGIGFAIVAGQFNAGFTGDQNLDLAITANGALLVRYGDGQREFPETRVIPSAAGTPTTLVALDFDQDGNTDLAAGVPANDTVTFFRQEETTDQFNVLRPDFVPAGSLPVAGNPLNLGSELLDADAFEDLIVSSTADERVQILAGNPYRHVRVRLGEAGFNGVPAVAFGNLVRDGGEIRGVVWEDLDADGVRDLSIPTTPVDPPLKTPSA